MMIELLSAVVLGAQLSAAGGMVTSTPPAASLEIVIYSDFQCPFCRKFAQPTQDIRSTGVNGMPAKVTFKHFPLPFHTNAQLAAQAAEAAKAQGKFWDMHDLLFANQAHLQRADLLGYARTLGLDLARFEADLDSTATKQAIAADVTEGTKAGITATPSYSINGRLFEGTRTVAELASLLAGERPPVRVASEITDTMLSKGPANAPVTIEFFADLQSPISQAALDAVEDVQHRYAGAVRVQFRSNPLAFHQQALLAHEAAMAAARSGQFWQFVRGVLAHQSSMREDDLVDIAHTLGLNEVQFRESLGQHRYRSRVETDRDDAARRGLRGSPAFVVNGRRIDGVPSVQTLAGSVDEALSELRSQAGTRK